MSMKALAGISSEKPETALPKKVTWQEFTCDICGATIHIAGDPPEDGLCGKCRAARAQKPSSADRTTLRDIIERERVNTKPLPSDDVLEGMRSNRLALARHIAELLDKFVNAGESDQPRISKEIYHDARKLYNGNF